MLAATAPGPFDSPEHAFEVKWDGYRALAFVDGGAVRLQSRQLRDLTSAFPAVQALGTRVDATPAVLDGEVIAFDREGRPSFSALRNGSGVVVYMAFDLLVVAGEELFGRGWEERRARLEAEVRPSEVVQLSPVVRTHGRALYQTVLRRDLEGMVAKAVASPYLPGQRSSHWLKVRNVKTADCVITGYTPGRGRLIGALLLGCYDRDDRLVYVGHVGTGFSEEEARTVIGLTRPHALPRPARAGPTVVEPELACSVEYLEWTPDRRLRHPVFRELRPDLDPRQCRLPGGPD
jgi:DNA ligase D-like protein (predicted ligase)